MPGAKTRKMHTSKRDAFKAINAKPFAKIQWDRIEIISEHKKRNKNKVKYDGKFEEKVAIVKIYPGQNPDILDYYLKNKYMGLVLEMSGLGHVPTKGRKSWIKKLKEIQNKGMIVCATAQTIHGRLNPLIYSNGREILSTGVIYLEDMLSETAFVKLGWVLAKTKNREEVKKLMLTNFAGEISERLEFEDWCECKKSFFSDYLVKNEGRKFVWDKSQTIQDLTDFLNCFPKEELPVIRWRNETYDVLREVYDKLKDSDYRVII